MAANCNEEAVPNVIIGKTSEMPNAGYANPLEAVRYPSEYVSQLQWQQMHSFPMFSGQRSTNNFGSQNFQNARMGYPYPVMLLFL